MQKNEMTLLRFDDDVNHFDYEMRFLAPANLTHKILKNDGNIVCSICPFKFEKLFGERKCKFDHVNIYNNDVEGHKSDCWAYCRLSERYIQT